MYSPLSSPKSNNKKAARNLGYPAFNMSRQEIKKNEKYFQAITENLPGGIAIINHRGKITYASPSGEAILGYDPKEVAGKNILKFVHADYKKLAIQRLSELLSKPNKVTNHKYKAKRKDGSTIWLSVTGTNFLYDSNIKGVIINFRDITHYVNEAKQKEFLENSFSVLADSLDFEKSIKAVAKIAVPSIADWCVIYMIEKGGVIKRSALVHEDWRQEKRAEKILAPYSEDPNNYLPVKEMVEAGEPVLYRDVSEEAIRSYSQHFLDYELAAKLAKSLKVESLILAPIKNRENLLGFMLFATANSGRKYTKDDLDFIKDFMGRVSITLDNSKMYSELQKANDAKDEFLASLSHELRNPLAPIVHSLDALKLNSGAAPEAKKEIATIDRQVKNMTRLLDDLLDVSRITSGSLKLNRGLVNMNEVIEQALQTTAPLLKARKHNLDVKVPDEPVFLEADPLRLEQILVNLLSNAIKYTNPGGKIKLTCKTSGDNIVIKVKDNGIGIDANLLPCIFESFVTANKKIDRPTQGGLGIGLNLAKNLVQMQGGIITAHSEGLDKGSEFTVTLPARRKTERNPGEKTGIRIEGMHGRRASDKPQDKDEAIEQNTTSTPKKKHEKKDKKILIVDDNEDAANALSKVLQKLNYKTGVAYDGAQALDKINSDAPCLILLDIGLPNMSGYEVAEKIRKLRGGKDIVLVALTGYGQPEDKKKAKDAGFDWHITKPVGVLDLKKILEKELA